MTSWWQKFNFWLPRSPSLKESIKPWDLTAVGLFLLSPTAVKLRGGFHPGATSTLCGRDFYYIQKGLPALPARTLPRWLGDPSKGTSPPGSLFTNTVYKQYLQTLFTNNIYKHCLQTIFTNTICRHNNVEAVEGDICKIKRNKISLF